MHGSARLREREPRGVRNPMTRRFGGQRQARLDDGPEMRPVIERLMRGEAERGLRVPIAQIDHRRPVEPRIGQARGAGRHARPQGRERRARSPRQLAGDRGHDARRPFLVAEHEGQPLHARRLDQLEVRASARHAEDARHPGVAQPLHDELRDGGHQMRARGRALTRPPGAPARDACGRAPCADWPRSSRTRAAGSPRHAPRRPCPRASPPRLPARAPPPPRSTAA